MFNNSAWLAQVKEAVLDPDRDIVDPHHHLWPQPAWATTWRNCWQIRPTVTTCRKPCTWSVALHTTERVPNI